MYGTGVCSTYGEACYVIGDPSANWPSFQLERMLRTGCYIDDFQATYFVIDCFEDLSALLQRTEFPTHHGRLRVQPELTPF